VNAVAAPPRLPFVERIREGWPDAVRMFLSAILAAGISQALGLPETYWAVLSALIVGRPQAGGPRRASRARLVGTVLGSMVAMAVIFARSWHPPEIVLLAAAMVPLSVLVTVFEEYRAAPAAAIIVLSAGHSAAAPFNLALLRLAEIAVGSWTSTLIAAVVLPSRTHAQCFRMGAALLAKLDALLHRSFHRDASEAEVEGAHEEVRKELRDLVTLVRSKGAAKGAGLQAARMAKVLARIQVDIMFIGRAARSLGGAAAAELALPLLFQTLQKDLGDLIRVLRPARTVNEDP
jgi:uncharacterized membrane protein YccC